MILVLAGTREARIIVEVLQQAGQKVLATTVTEYGRQLLEENSPVLEGGLTATSLVQLLKEQDIQLVVDATHPFAVQVSQLAVEVCQQVGVNYVRFEREETTLPSAHQDVKMVESFAAAAQLALEIVGNVFLTVGANHLETFCRYIPKERLVVRVLPVLSSLTKCADLGIAPARIIAMQGPFSQELNVALFRQYQAGVIISKESGPTGGTDTKLEAARALGLPVILVQRPQVAYPQVVRSIEALLTIVASDVQD